jgi:glycosyltransferase involved in cell wall biosynthesis
MSVRKVGLLLDTRGMWQGGRNYYENLLQCYSVHGDPAMQLHVFSPDSNGLDRYNSDFVHVHMIGDMPWMISGSFADKASRALLGYNFALLRVLEKSGIEVLSHNGLGKQSRIPTLPWMPDLQYKVYPHFFEEDDRKRRDRFVRGAAVWGNILLSSNSTAKDFRKYYPELETVKTRILQFCSSRVLAATPDSIEELEKMYGVKSPYIYVPNQFWKHKNHGVILEALRMSPAHIRVVCTGEMRDSRNPQYSQELMDRVRQYGLEERFLCLDVVPFQAVVSLMHYAVAVLNPSLFEGWSTTVEEAKAMRKRVILSDIDVHREQNPERGEYFSPNEAVQLSGCMLRAVESYDPAEEARYCASRLTHMDQVQQNFAHSFASIFSTMS